MGIDRSLIVYKFIIIFLIVLLPFSSKALEPLGVNVLGTAFVPALQVKQLYDDNIFTTKDHRVASWISKIHPILDWQVRHQSHVYTLIYEAELGYYYASTADNYQDYKLQLDTDFQFGSRLNWHILGQYLQGHDARGSTDRVDADEADVYHIAGFRSDLKYGAEGAIGQIQWQSEYLRKRYDNNRASTQAFDLNQWNMGLSFLYRVFPKSYLLFSVDTSDIDFIFSESTQDNQIWRLSVGGTWKATMKTTGNFKVGYIDKDFESASRDDFSGFYWKGEMEWKALSYSTFTFKTAKKLSDSTGIGDFTVIRHMDVDWRHQWLRRLESVTHISLAEAEYGGNSDRDDDRWEAGLELRYEMRRWLELGLRYSYTKVDSNLDINDYRRKQWLFVIEATL